MHFIMGRTLQWASMHTFAKIIPNLYKHPSEIPQIHSQLIKNGEKIEEMEKLITNLRIRYAELSKISPGHPSRHPNNFTEDIKLQQ